MTTWQLPVPRRPLFAFAPPLRSDFPGESALAQALLPRSISRAISTNLGTRTRMRDVDRRSAFVAAKDHDFDNMRRFYRTTRVKIELQ